jgi:glutathione S-transferase
MYRLHGFCQSGNTFKVAMALHLLQQPWEGVFVDYLRGGVTRQDGWRADLNEMGEAPVLEFTDGDETRRLSQSGLILSVLAERHADRLPSLGGRDARERQEVLRWILFDNHKFTSYLATYRFLKSFGATAPDPAVMAFLKGRMDAALAIVDKHLSRAPYMVGDHLSIADISISGYLFYPEEETGCQILERHAHLAQWMARLRALPGLRSPYEMLPGERIAPRW